MPRNNKEAKKELIKAWLEHSDNENEKTIIDRFNKEYNSRCAFYWYSKVMFLYSALNQALRERDIDLIFAMRFFIIDLTQQLIDKHHQYLMENSDKKRETHSLSWTKNFSR
jgi:hypothetical protein